MEKLLSNPFANLCNFVKAKGKSSNTYAEATMMSQCEHEFAPDPITKEVRCIKCGDLDDEMELPNNEILEKEKMDEFYRTQQTFE